MVSIPALITANNKRWASARMTRGPSFQQVALRLVNLNAKAVYVDIEKETGVPWWVIAVIHEREASQNWSANIAQGDPFNKVSVHVPKGRGPFPSFKAAALDALRNCPPYAARWKDWTIGGALTLLEQYNGTGYAIRGLPSPYIWSGTTIYDPPTGPGGKYVADGVFSATAVDKQLGCAGLLIAMAALDKSIAFAGPAVPVQPPLPAPVHEPSPGPVPQPAPAPSPAAAGFWAALGAALMRILGGIKRG